MEEQYRKSAALAAPKPSSLPQPKRVTFTTSLVLTSAVNTFPLILDRRACKAECMQFLHVTNCCPETPVWHSVP